MVKFTTRIFQKVVMELLIKNPSMMVIKATIKKVVAEGFKIILPVAGSGFLSAAQYVAKELAKRAITSAGKQPIKAILGSALNPIGIVADLAQLGLEMAGYKKEGRAVGAVGNAVGGAVAGFFIAGPVGAVVGAAAGYGTWGIGEAVGGFVQRKLFGT